MQDSSSGIDKIKMLPYFIGYTLYMEYIYLVSNEPVQSRASLNLGKHENVYNEGKKMEHSGGPPRAAAFGAYHQVSQSVR